MQTMTIEIEDLKSMITSSLDRLIGEINPTIEKFQNTTIDILSVSEDRLKINVSQTIYWLETNLFVLLFAIILFCICILILLNLLDNLLAKYRVAEEKRPYAGLVIITVISVWLFIAIILSSWPPTSEFNLQTFKYILVGLLSLLILFLIGTWIYCLCSNWTSIKNYITFLCNGCKSEKIFTVGESRTTPNNSNEIDIPLLPHINQAKQVSYETNL